jgi:hypothetical protein
MSMVRARFDGKAFIPETAVHLPVGEIVEIRFGENDPAQSGRPAEILRGLQRLPKVSAEDVAELERLINEGTPPAEFGGIFDDDREAPDDRSNGG